MPPKLSISLPLSNNFNFIDDIADKFNEIIKKIVDLNSNNILIEQSGKLYKGNVEIDNSVLKLNKGDEFANFTMSGANVAQGMSGSSMKKISINNNDYIQKGVPESSKQWGSFKRELVAMKLFQGSNYILVPEFIILKDNGTGIITKDDFSLILLVTKACKPCKQGESSCSDSDKKINWDGIDLSEKKNLLRFVDDIENGIKEMDEKQFYHKDIKPDNIVYCDNKFQIIDFGVSEIGKQDALKSSGTAYFMESTTMSMTPESIIELLKNKGCLREDPNEKEKENAIMLYLKRIDYFSLLMTLKIIVKSIPKYKMLEGFLELIISDFNRQAPFLNEQLYDVDDIMRKIKLILNMKIGTICKIMRDNVREERTEVSLFDQSQSQDSLDSSQDSSQGTPQSSVEGGRKRRKTKRKKDKNRNKKQRKTKRRKN